MKRDGFVKNKMKKSKGRILIDRFKNNKIKTVVYVVLLAIVITQMIIEITEGKTLNIPTYILIFALMMIPSAVEVLFGIEMPTVLEIIIICFIFSAYHLGEANAFYTKIKEWDLILHTLNGFISAGIGCGMINILNHRKIEKMNLTPIFVVMFSFCFSMTTGIVWEFIEYGMDSIVGTDMQKDTFLNSIHSFNLYSIGHGDIGWINDIKDVAVNGKSIGHAYIDLGLNDTMKDMLLNCTGAIVFNILCFINLKSEKSEGRFIKNFIPYSNKTTDK